MAQHPPLLLRLRRPRLTSRSWAFRGEIKAKFLLGWKLNMKHFRFLLNSIVGKILLLLSTFLVGVVSHSLWFEVSSPTVTLCQIAQNPERFDGKTIRVEADGRSVFGAVFIADETCSSHDAAAGVWLADGYKPSGEAQNLYAESETEVREARIVATGRFDAHATRGCWSPKAAIHATSVELKSEITTEPLKERPEEE